MSYPDTIRYPNAFDRNQPAGFDGIFNWKWTEGCFGHTTIRPMDFDGVVERYGHYLVFETKDLGVEIPQGQKITLAGLRNPKDFCVMKIWGKDEPEYFKITTLHKGHLIEIEGWGVNEAREYIRKWFEWANRH